ncbi:MAG: signal peptidase II [Planctomycetes bacterium HGW-Planctomycetes-1]|nr:MAG: signal peptidase II [Planctomycetes bacterium HGW-Planctomycetes-1]
MSQTPDKSCCCCLTRQLNLPSAHLLFWPVFLIGLVADLWSKSAVFNWLSSQSPQRYSIIDGFFQLVIVENRGAAWGIAADKTITLVVISILAFIVIFSMFLFGRKLQMAVVLALALFAAGICGNLYDRLFNDGKVRDFLDFYYKEWHFPAFNIADSMLTVAVFILILMTIFCPKSQQE